MIIFVLALIVLGPEKLPRVVSELGRWVGRARAMARQFREQLEEEVQLEEARKAQQRAASAPPVEPEAGTAKPHGEAAASAGASRAPGNGGGSELTPEVSYAHHPQPGDPAQPTEHMQTAGAPTADPAAGRPAQTGGADDERRT